MNKSTNRYTRIHLLSLHQRRSSSDEDGARRAVNVADSEAEKLAGFAGEALSRARANAAMLLGVAIYMLVVEPQIAVLALAFLLLQVAITPLLQRKFNVLIEDRVELLRNLGDEISNENGKAKVLLNSIYSNRMRFFCAEVGLEPAKKPTKHKTAIVLPDLLARVASRHQSRSKELQTAWT